MKKQVPGKLIIALFIITNAVYLFMILYTIPMVQQYANDMDLFDMMPTGYSYEYAISLLTTLGEEGRHLYLTRQIPVDMFYPALFAFTYYWTMHWFLARMPKHNFLNLAAVAPLIAGCFDYLENIGVIIMINSFPNVSNHVAGLSTLFTTVKSGATSLFFLAFIGTVILYFIHRRKQPKAA